MKDTRKLMTDETQEMVAYVEASDQAPKVVGTLKIELIVKNGVVGAKLGTHGLLPDGNYTLYADVSTSDMEVEDWS